MSPPSEGAVWAWAAPAKARGAKARAETTEAMATFMAATFHRQPANGKALRA